MKRIISAILMVCCLLLIFGCSEGGKLNDEPNYGTDYKSVKDQLIGKWVLVSYTGIDGKTQAVSRENGGTFYIFTKDTVSLHWSDGIEQNGNYEWYFVDSEMKELNTIKLHFNAAASDDGDTEASSADLYFAISFDDYEKNSNLHIRVQETGEEMVLTRE